MKSMSTTRPERQRGFAIVSAIFILVVLAALGGFIATISTTQNAGSALDIQSAYAYQAARAGTEWGIFQVVNGAPATPANTVACSATVPAPAISFNGMTVTVCMQQQAAAPGSALPAGAVTEAGLTAIWLITSTACNIPDGLGNCPGNAVSPNYVERRLTVLVER